VIAFEKSNMTNALFGLWPSTTIHNTRKEGIRLGLIVGTVAWLWVALIDVVAGRPWRTFTMLGGILVFTAVHYLLNLVYGTAVLSAVHGAEHAPSLVIAAVFGGVTFEGAVIMFATILIQQSHGNVAWLGIVGGNLGESHLAPRSNSIDQATSLRVCHGLEPIVGAQLAIDVMQVIPEGVPALRDVACEPDEEPSTGAPIVEHDRRYVDPEPVAGANANIQVERRDAAGHVTPVARRSLEAADHLA
jgi:hypothetical protein